MSNDMQEGFNSQDIDYDNLVLPDPDDNKEEDKVESEEETDEVTEEVTNEAEEEVTEDTVDGDQTEDKPTEDTSEKVEEVQSEAIQADEPTEEVQEPSPIFDVSAETEGVIKDLKELKEVSQVLSDPFFNKLYNYYKSTGDVKPFLDANSKDYSKMSDIDILQLKHREDYKDFDLEPQVLAHLFEEEVLSKFEGKDDDGLEGKVALAKLKREASKARSSFIETQNEFLAPTLEEKPKIDEVDTVRQRNEARKLAANQLKDVVKDNKLSVEISEGVDAIKLDIDPSQVIEAAINPMEWMSRSIVKNGVTDWSTLSQMVAFTNNPQGFLQNLYKHGNNLGQKKFVEKNLKNKPKVSGRKPTNSISSSDPYSLEAFRNAKRIN
tara:strand:- start:2378 stop:3517 length:1140 start_codon:yes stop_codon:yes gene_type:complete